MATSTLVTTWGGSSSNAYADEAFVTQYVEDYILNDTKYTEASTGTRAKAILRATRDIDNSHLWLGERRDTTQALQFPREIEFRDSFFDDTIPVNFNTESEFIRIMEERVKNACAEQTVYLLKNQTSDTEHMDRQRQGIASFSESVGPLSESISYAGGGANNSPMRRLSADAQMFIKHYVGSTNIVRGGSFEDRLFGR